MKIVDSTIWCAPYELDLLHLKMELESPCVDEFVVTECHFNYHGKFKGPTVLEAMRADRRFDRFRDKVTVVSVPQNLSCPDPRLEGVVDPAAYGQAEVFLRDAPTQYLLNKYSDNDVVLNTDVDECFDFTDEERRDRILSHLYQNQAVQFDRVRYHWDVDVRAYREKFDCITPAYSIKCLKTGFAKLHDKKWVGEPVPCGRRPLVFEYCCCFSYLSTLDKFASSLHTQWDDKLIYNAILTATWPRTTYQGQPDKNNRWHWFERVALTEDNSPKYVRDNLATLRTNLVPDDYKANRLHFYDVSPEFPENNQEA